MNNVILLTENELQEKISNAVQQALSKIEAPKPTRKSKLDINEAKDFLNQIGYKCSLSQLYKGSMTGDLPLSKFGRRIMFDAEELSKWVDSKKSKTIDISMVVAKCAASKMGK